MVYTIESGFLWHSTEPAALPPDVRRWLSPAGGVINAGLIVGLSNDALIGLVSAESVLGPWLGVLGFVGVIFWLYGWMLRRSVAVR